MNKHLPLQAQGGSVYLLKFMPANRALLGTMMPPTKYILLSHTRRGR